MLIFIFLLTTAISCPVTKKQKGPSFTEFRTGTGAMELEFMDTIPESIPEGQPFQIGIHLSNVGASNALGQILLKTDTKAKFQPGTSYDFVNDNDHAVRAPFELMGKSVDNPVGEETIKFFNAQIEDNVVYLSEYEESEIKATLCYNYGTYAVMDVCVDPKQYIKTRLEQKACEVKEITSSGQGGPIVITKVIPSYRFKVNEDEVTPTFEITIENDGEGTPYWWNPEQECGAIFDTEEKKVLNRVKVFAKLSTETNTLDCHPKTLYVADKELKELAVLRDGIAEVICEAPPIPVEKAAYVTPLFVHTLYGYMQEESTTFKILNTNQEEEERAAEKT